MLFESLCCILTAIAIYSPVKAQWWNFNSAFQRKGIFKNATSVKDDLKQFLSTSSLVIDPDDPRWASSVSSYQALAAPRPQWVVTPKHEADIAKIVDYANKRDIDFRTVNRAHSLTLSGDSFAGIQIDLRGLANIKVQPDKATVLLGGGARNHEVVQKLWALGYVTTSGACSCVGMVGPALGGGHGLLQGRLGLISDNIVRMNVILANGTTVEVNKNTHHDLWWAMRGAGHNFGIVSSFEMKIYPIPEREWHYKTYSFTEEKLELLFEELNQLYVDRSLPDELDGGHFGVFTMDRSLSESKAIIIWTFVFSGPSSASPSFLQPFEKLGAVSSRHGTTSYANLSDTLGSGLASEMCQAGQIHVVSTAGLNKFNATAERQIYDLYNQKVTEYPQLGNTRILHEAYNTRAVLDVSSVESAFAQREELLLMYFDGTPSKGAGLENFVDAWAKETRNIWNYGQPGRLPTTYVNYARGDESVESMYGHESWRLEKLRVLKNKYDPNNRFRFYNPIIPVKQRVISDREL